MNAMTEIQPQSHSAAFSALMLELAKCLKLVAPITMSADAQMVWLQAAVDALEGIHAQEVASISAELRRSVTRPAQIVPEIARLVAEKRRRSAFAGSGQMTALQWAEGAKERNLPKHYEAWMAEAKRRGEI
jgi:hypothetical protein